VALIALMIVGPGLDLLDSHWSRGEATFEGGVKTMVGELKIDDKPVRRSPGLGAALLR
jgi:hypothetical protein